MVVSSNVYVYEKFGWTKNWDNSQEKKLIEQLTQESKCFVISACACSTASAILSSVRIVFCRERKKGFETDPSSLLIWTWLVDKHCVWGTLDFLRNVASKSRHVRHSFRLVYLNSESDFVLNSIKLAQHESNQRVEDSSKERRNVHYVVSWRKPVWWHRTNWRSRAKLRQKTEVLPIRAENSPRCRTRQRKIGTRPFG